MGYEFGFDVFFLIDVYREYVVKLEEMMIEFKIKLEEYGEIVENFKKKVQEDDKKKNVFQMGVIVW